MVKLLDVLIKAGMPAICCEQHILGSPA